MSRTQWCCLAALLAVVMGLFCGPAATAATVTPAAMATPAATVAVAPAHGAEAVTAPAVSAAVSVAPSVASVDEDRRGSGIPGCGKKRGHDGTEPAVPARTRTAHDQAPGLVHWGLPAAVGQEPPRSLVRIRPRAPAPATPTPVELSVLRV
ncbi:hypothetical protein OG413_09410 [Streptomyces sp. NBC_01433]|uniref:hypothetical protein n=1 Tax=Streptomyces sp. NBC_01433 TaxID=2903864 RepID=UPI0022502C8A|nr:hypothetical protein [Streptomyces sp. NBC_01433]MCX4675528.1 hypothetical protein [Streptomyces sp. NBC_01433]